MSAHVLLNLLNELGTSKRQRNSMVSLRMCSVKMNTPRSRFWIGLHLS